MSNPIGRGFRDFTPKWTTASFGDHYFDDLRNEWGATQLADIRRAWEAGWRLAQFEWMLPSRDQVKLARAKGEAVCLLLEGKGNPKDLNPYGSEWTYSRAAWFDGWNSVIRFYHPDREAKP